jgi:hypothetical protein
MFKTTSVKLAGREIDAFEREEITRKCERCSNNARFYKWSDKPFNHIIRFYCSNHWKILMAKSLRQYNAAEAEVKNA